MPETDAHPAVNPQALVVPDAARLLTTVGGRLVSEKMLRTDIEVGAPRNQDGTLNLVHYAAWLVREMGRGAGERHAD